MKVVGSYLVLGNQPNAALQPEDGAGPVLDSIAAAGDTGAAIPLLAQKTGFNADFVADVLKTLKTNGMVTGPDGDAIYKLTEFGAKARFMVKR